MRGSVNICSKLKWSHGFVFEASVCKINFIKIFYVQHSFLCCKMT